MADEEIDLAAHVETLRKLVEREDLEEEVAQALAISRVAILGLMPVKNPQVEVEPDGVVRIDLMHPPQLSDGTAVFESIRLRRPNFKDVEVIVKPRSPGEEKLIIEMVIDALAQLSTLKRAQVEKLDRRDLDACRDAYILAMGND